MDGTGSEQTNGMITVLIRFLIVYFLLSFSMKLLGKRQIGQMQQSEFITTLFLSELASFVITDPSVPLLFGLLPVLVMLALEVLISFGSVRVPFLKKSFDTPASFLIRDGKLDQKELLNNRITIEELMSMLRLSGAFDISAVRDAILEPNGQLSVIQNDGSATALAVVEDGVVNEKALSLLGRDKAWLRARLREKKAEAEGQFLVCADPGGVRFVAGKDGKKKA